MARIGAGGPFIVPELLPQIESGILGTCIIANGPQVDLGRLAGAALIFATAATPAGGPHPVEFQFGTHAQAIYQAEALKTQIFKSVRTPPTIPVLGTFVYVPPQSYVDTPSVVFKSAASSVSQIVRPFVSAPQALDLTQASFIQRSSPGYQGPTVRPFVSTPQLADFTQQSLVFPAAPTAPAVPAFIFQGPQNPETRENIIWKPAWAALSGPIFKLVQNPYEDVWQGTTFVLESLSSPNPDVLLGTFISVSSQLEDRPFSKIFPAARSAATQPLGNFIVSAPQVADFTIQAVLTKPFVRTTGLLGSFFVSAPQSLDLTQQSVLFKPLVGPAPAVLGASVWAPPQYDLTQQSWVFKSALTPPAPFAVISQIISAPQLVDLTQQSVIFPSAVEGTVTPPTVAEGPFPVGHPVYVKKRPKSALEEFREIFAKIHEQPPVVGFPAKTLKPAVVQPTTPKTLVREVLRDRSAEFAQIREIVKDVQKRREDDDDDDEAFLLLS